MQLAHDLRNTLCGMGCRMSPATPPAEPRIEFGLATKAETPQLVELLGTLFSIEADFVPNAAKQQRAVEMILGDPRIGVIYVAREAGRVVGMVSTLYTVSTAEGGMSAWLEDMVVRPECRGRGVGAGLLEYAVVGAREAGVRRLTLLSDEDAAQAHAVYASEGFQFSGMRVMRLKL